jgi:hypothetical protein
MQNSEEEAPDQSNGRHPRLRPGKNPATIGAIATVLAAVIAGVFTLLATHESSNANSVNILQSLSSGPSGVVAAGGSGGGGGGTFLADMTALHGPRDNDISDTVGGRAITKALGIAVGDNATYSIPAGAKTFLASVGMSDTLENGLPPADSKGVFGIWGDTTLLRQLNLSVGQLAVISVPVAGYKVLRLTYTGPFLTEGDFGLARFAS